LWFSPSSNTKRSAILLGKNKIITVVGVTLLVGGAWATWNTFSGSDDEALDTEASVATMSPSEAKPMMQNAEPITPKKTELVEDVDPEATFAQAREGMIELQGLLADLQRLKALSTGADKKKYRLEQKELKKKMKAIQKEVRALLPGSEMARNELLSMVEAENDPKVKKGLAKLYKGLDDESQATYYSKLTDSESLDTQKLGVKMLSGVSNETSMIGLVGVVNKAEAPHKLKNRAVMGLALSLGQSEPDSEYRIKASAALKDFAKTAQDPKVRESAFRAIAFKRGLTAADHEFVNVALREESDPDVRRAAEFAQKVMKSRSRTK
jgi:hypothetical protein